MDMAAKTASAACRVDALESAGRWPASAVAAFGSGMKGALSTQSDTSGWGSPLGQAVNRSRYPDKRKLFALYETKSAFPAMGAGDQFCAASCLVKNFVCV